MCRETSNALNASVRYEQKRLHRLSETVPADNRIPQAVRQGIPDRRTSHTESQSAIGAELVTQYDQELSGGVTACTIVQHYNGTRYCRTDTVLLIFPFLQTSVTS